MAKVIAVEEGLSGSIKSALEKEGYRVVKPGTAEKIDATILTGLDMNVMGMQDIQDKSTVIDASGKTPEQILRDLKARL
ncbi:YkuS family protein [Pelotomaculum propionicicum]|uniref:YkuS family protein n=1 Tax=Pelotomaculum propionicicum TaxID=258475 RepID=A0A4Y7RXH1_9FIRM|nr:YkuS family protein [Pelotomaculum propionicicum]NLI14528.1 YkuS family protein [Peptococcaceae bacterium]TEB13698.1 hypothetical protein Pmgp_00101 [Pelotomaculum propionicicum]